MLNILLMWQNWLSHGNCVEVLRMLLFWADQLLTLYYQLNMTFEFLTALFWWIQVFRHIIVRHWTSGFQHFEGM
jgi:hypothetical protein